LGENKNNIKTNTDVLLDASKEVDKHRENKEDRYTGKKIT
jgi:hypothetical protein